MSDSAITSGSDGLRPVVDTIMDKDIEKSCIKLYKKAHQLRLPKYKALEHRARSDANSMETKPEAFREMLAGFANSYRLVEAQARQLADQGEATFVRGIITPVRFS